MMKLKSKGLIIVAAALLMMTVLVPVYAHSQNGTMQQDRDQDCTPQGPATRAYGEDPPVQAQEEKSEGLSEENLEEAETPLQEQTQTQEQLRDCTCENEDCEQYQYQYQHLEQYQYQHGQEEQD
jgi:hypothetical protein